MANSLAGAVEPFFRRRGERVVAAASVVETDRGMLKKAKARILALVGPVRSIGHDDDVDDTANVDLRQASVVVLAFGGESRKDAYSVRQELPVAQLHPSSPEHVGSTEAAFETTDNTDGAEGGTVRVSFESAVQREVFTAAVRKAKRVATRGMGAAMVEDDSVLTRHRAISSGGGGSSADAVAGSTGAYGKVQRKRNDAKNAGVLSVEEELLLAKEARLLGMNLADARGFELALAARIAETEAKAVREVLTSGDDWAEASEAVNAMRDIVTNLESRVHVYSEELLSRRDVIQDIELESTYRRRKKQNLERVIDELDATMAHLRLPEADSDAILQLVDLEAGSPQLQAYFANPRNVRALVSCIQHIERLLRDPPTEARRYRTIESVQERAMTFDDLRGDVATKTAVCIDVVAERASRHLLEDRGRKSNRGRLTLLPPVAVFEMLEPLAPLFAILRTTNYRRHCSAVRRFAAHMRQVYSFETRRFFAELRRIVRRVGWRGSQLLGDTDASASAGRVKRMAAQGDLTPSPMLTPMRRSSRSGSVERGRSPSADGRDSTDGNFDPKQPPQLVLYRDDEAGFRLVRLGVPFMPPTTEVRKRDIVAGYAAPGGFMRPDMAFAAALKATSDLVLVQRTFLVRCLGLRALPRRWMNALRRAKEGGDNFAPGSPTSIAHITGLSEEEAAAALAEVPLEERDELDLDDVSPALLDVTVADEVNTALWETFAADGDYVANGDTLVHKELVQLATTLADKCDGLHLLPALAMVDKMLAFIDDGDEKSSAPLDAMRRRRRGATAGGTGGLSNMSLGQSVFAGAGSGADGVDADLMQTFIDSRDGFYTRTLRECRAILGRAFQVYVAQQGESINESAKENKGSPRLMGAFAALPVLFARIDGMLACYADLPLGRVEGFLRNIVHHLFDRLDAITIRARDDEDSARKHAVFMQYLHHAFFAVTVTTSVSPELRGMLADFLSTSVSRRDHYESVYITNDVFPTAFPRFASFMAVADEARRMFSAPEDLRCHGSLKPEKLEPAIAKIAWQMEGGVESATSRLKKHFARAVPTADPAEDAFFRAALPVTFQHLRAFVGVKLQSLSALLDDLQFVPDEPLPTLGELEAMFDDAGR